MVDLLFFELWVFWLILGILCLIIELLSGTLYLLCFSIGLFVACLASFLDISFSVQLFIFAFASLLSIFFIRPFALNVLHREENQRASNIDALIGRIGIVTEKIEEEGSGYIKVDGDEWKAISQNGNDIPKDSKVKIIEMNSIIATVQEI